MTGRHTARVLLIGPESRMTASEMKQEQHRRTVVRLICAVYWLMIVEGVLRKWIWPQWGRQLFFIRDPLVIWIYLLVWSRGVRVMRSLLYGAGLAFGLVGAGLIVIQAAFGNTPIGIFPIYGWR